MTKATNLFKKYQKLEKLRINSWTAIIRNGTNITGTRAHERHDRYCDEQDKVAEEIYAILEAAEKLERAGPNAEERLRAAATELLAELTAITDRFEETLEATHATRTDRRYIKDARAAIKKATGQ